MISLLKTMAELAHEVSTTCSWRDEVSARRRLAEACTPETILALAAEVEGLRERLELTEKAWDVQSAFDDAWGEYVEDSTDDNFDKQEAARRTWYALRDQLTSARTDRSST